MTKAAVPTLPRLMHSFFHEWLVEQRNASHRTVLAYRDAWRMFLRFVSARQRKKVAALGLESLTAAEVIAFLQHIEQERKSSVRTRNCRLAAIRSFFSFVADHEPLAARALHRRVASALQKAPQRALPGVSRSLRAPFPSGSKETGRTARPRAAIVSVQHRSADTGSTQRSAPRLAPEIAESRDDDGKGPERADLPNLAGNGEAARSTAVPAIPPTRRAPFRQSLMGHHSPLPVSASGCASTSKLRHPRRRLWPGNG